MTPLRIERDKRGWSQRELEALCKKAGLKIEQGSLSRIEHSTRSRAEPAQTGATAAQAAILSQVFGHAISEAQILYPGDYVAVAEAA